MKTLNLDFFLTFQATINHFINFEESLSFRILVWGENENETLELQNSF